MGPKFTYTLSVLVLSLASQAVFAQSAPSAYMSPSSDDDIGIKTIIDVDNTRDFTNAFQGYSRYDNYYDTSTVRGKARVTITQLPVTSRNEFPVNIEIGGPNPIDVGTYANSTHSSGGQFFSAPNAYNKRVGSWIKEANLQIKYSGDSSSPGSYLTYSYPDTQNNSVTQTYSNQEQFQFQFNASLSSSASGSTGMQFTYTKNSTVGASVNTQQMNVTKSNSSGTGNAWRYLTQLDTSGRNIEDAKSMWNRTHDENEILKAVPQIALHFTPAVGQKWKIPRGVSQKFDITINPIFFHTEAVESWNAGYSFYTYSGIFSYPNGGLYNQTVTLNTDKPALSGINYFRFRYANLGQCMTPTSGHHPGFAMRDCNTSNDNQYVTQNSNYMLVNKNYSPLSQTEGQWFQDKSLGSGWFAVVNGNFVCYGDRSSNSCSSQSTAPSGQATWGGPQTVACGREVAYISNKWCEAGSWKYLPYSIKGESGILYGKFIFTDNGSIKTLSTNYLIDVDSNNGYTPIVRDVNTTGTREGLWKYMVF